MMKLICNLLSVIFSPLLVPTYGVILAVSLSLLSVLPAGVLVTTVAVTFALTCLIPLTGILALYKIGFIKDATLNQRTERTLPYILTAVCYLGCGFFLYRASAPMWLSMFFAGGAAAVFISVIVNRWWKISAHAAGMGGLVALLFRIDISHYAIHTMDIWISAAIIITGMVLSARVYLSRHTLLQVLAGVANGFLCVWLFSML